jgi:flagellar secretion chaperone FliS
LLFGSGINIQINGGFFMALNKAYSQYKENSIFTASPEELTLMLYNGLVRFIMQAQNAVDNKDISKVHESIIRAQDIIREFQSTLDMKYEISKSLMLIYDYMYRRLLDANIKKDKDILEEVLGYAKELRDTWSQAMKIAKQGTNQGRQAIAK